MIIIDFQGNVGNDQIDWNVHHSLLYSLSLSLSNLCVSRPVCVKETFLKLLRDFEMYNCVCEKREFSCNKKIHTLIKICVLRKFWFRVSAQISLSVCVVVLRIYIDDDMMMNSSAYICVGIVEK